MKYLGICSNVRKEEKGEKLWVRMMEIKQPISLLAFALIINQKDFTHRFGINFREANMQDPSCGAFLSKWGRHICIFYQNAGFEYIWLL